MQRKRNKKYRISGTYSTQEKFGFVYAESYISAFRKAVRIEGSSDHPKCPWRGQHWWVAEGYWEGAGRFAPPKKRIRVDAKKHIRVEIVEWGNPYTLLDCADGRP